VHERGFVAVDWFSQFTERHLVMSTSMMRVRVIGFMMIMILGLSVSFGQTISGSIQNDTTWTIGTVIADSVYIPSGKTLTIAPGTIVKFNSGKSLVIAGKLVADGTLADQITFTANSGSPAPGSWNSIEFQNTSNAGSVFNYCVVSYAGGGPNAAAVFYKTGAYAVGITKCTIKLSSTNGVNVRASSPSIKNSSFCQNGGYGIFSDFLTTFALDSSVVAQNTVGGIRIAVNATPTVTNSRIDSNGVGIFMDNGARPTITNNYIRNNSIGLQFTGIGSGQPTIMADTITGNTQWGFYNSSTTQTVRAERNYWGSDTGPYSPTNNPTGMGDRISMYVDFQPWSTLAGAMAVTNVTANISSNTTWAGGVYWVKNSITINSGVTLTINPGVVVKCAPGVRITWNGAVNATGLSNNMIVFTSDRDDSYGGDTNGDGSATGPNPGDWDMAYLTNYVTTSVLANCVFKFGGYNGYGNLYFENSSPTTLTNIYSTNSSNYGLRLNNSNPNIYGSTFGGNGSYGVYAHGTSRYSMRKCVVTGNAATGIVSDGGSSFSSLVLLDSSIVSRNVGGGIYSWYATGIQTISNNQIDSNSAYGVWTFNVGGPDTVKYLNNTIYGNGSEGIITSRAYIANNTINNNRYAIALLGRVNTTYSGNTIAGNTYNNSIALRLNRYEESFADTLKAVFPAGMTSKTYSFIENAPGYGVLSGVTLVIQPGVIIKMDPGMYFRVDGTLKADASSGNPIVFTSYRDSLYGGKTNLATDYSKPTPNDWRYVRIRTGASVGTVLNNMIFKFGGWDGYGNLWFESQASLTTPVTNIISRKSSSMGIRVGDSQISFVNAVVDSNAGDGIYIEGNSANGSGISNGTDMTLQNCTITDNGGTGLRAVHTSAFRQVSNCTIRRNAGWGIGIDNGSIQQSFSGNVISNNSGGGIWNNSGSILATDLQYIGNTVADHPNEDGILSTRARFVDNALQRNRYPIGVWGRIGNIYTDNSGVDGNVISGNTFNNAISVRGSYGAPLSDTLKNVFPAAITSRTYVVIEDVQVNNGSTFVIQPNVNLKFQQHALNVYGTLNAQGTQANPIIFTSWRDSTAGGKTIQPTDWSIPQPGDWYYVWFRNGSGASVARYCQFKLAGRDGEKAVRFEDGVSGVTFTNNLIRRSSSAGIFIVYSKVTIDSTVVDSCASYGIRLYSDSRAGLALRNSKLQYNSSYGFWAQNPSYVTELTNCAITGNNATGAYIENNGSPGVALRVQSTTVNNNNGHGLYFLAQNDAIDTLILFSNCRVFNNANTGIFSSRAYFLSDSIYSNRYAVGLVGQLSKDSTGNVLGNVYRTNTVFSNTFKKTLVTEGAIFGKIGGSFLEGDTAKVVAVRGDASVPSGQTLTVLPGTVIKFPKEYGNGRLEVQGNIRSEGSATNKIVFTSWKDDTYGGDSNADSNATVPAPGNWDMLYLNGGNSASHIFNTIIRYGGSTNNGNLYIVNNSTPVDSSFSSYSSSDGIVSNGGSPTITATEVHHNVSYGFAVWNSGSPVFHYNNIHDNTNGGLWTSSSSTLNATNNYWGAVLGPYKNQGTPQNLAGTGNRIYLNSSGDVTFSPYLATRSGVMLGDVSQNGTITSFDASLILRHVVSPLLTPSQLAAADVTGDGTVSALDASYILRYSVGLITGFPGLGKRGSDPMIADAYELKTLPDAVEGERLVVLHLNGKFPLYAAEIQLSYDSTLVEPVAVKKMQPADEMMMDSQLASESAGVAMAATAPISEEGDIVTFVFRLRDKAKGATNVAFKVEKLVLNETNLKVENQQLTVPVPNKGALPTSFGLDQNYPNPFNPTTTIAYELPALSQVTIRIYDVLGHELRTIVNGEQKPGYYRITWDGRDELARAISSGVYFYRMDAVSNENRHFSTVRKMMLLK
jgi:parallel beta-helix repeat protein